MGLVAALLDGRAATTSLRRTLPRGVHTLLVCRNGLHLARAVETRLLEAIVLGSASARAIDLAALRRLYPAIPLVVFGVFRPDDGDRILALADPAGADAVLVEGLDDAVLADTVTRMGQSNRRAVALRDGPRLLRLTEPLQRAAWDALIRTAPVPVPTATLASRLRVSREHLSRQFGAGGAPNLKRVIDLLRVVAVRDVLSNPGYTPLAAARLLGFATPSHLGAVVRRVTRLPVRDLPRTSIPDLLRRFLRTGMRSRT